MLLSEYLLLEDKATFIATKQHNAIILAYQADRGHRSLSDNASAQEIVNELRKADPTGGKYLQWIVNMYVGKQFKLEDINSIHDELKEFTRVRTKLAIKDINQYKKLTDLYTALEPHADTTVKSGKQQKKELSDKFYKDGEAKLFYKDDKVTIIIPKTLEASCYFGQGTKWCTASKNNNMFAHYAKDGLLYIVQTPGGKYQFHFESDSFMDEQDQQVDVVDLANKYPSLKTAFNAIAVKLLYLPLIKDVTPEIEMSAVKENGWALQYVKEQTPELAMAAVKRHGMALQFVKDQTPEVVIAAVKRTVYALQHVKDQTPGLMMRVVKQNPMALQHIKEQTPEIEMAAVKRDGWMLHYVKEQTPELAMAAVKQNGLVLEIVEKQTYDLAMTAVDQNQRALAYVDFKFRTRIYKHLGMD